LIYEYQCPECGRRFEVSQGMAEVHTYKCPSCDVWTERVWNLTPQFKKNEGFFTESFKPGGEYVGSMTEYDRKLAEVRTLTGMDEYLGVNKPVPESVDRRERQIEQRRKEAAREVEMTQEYVHNLREHGEEPHPGFVDAT